jgi:CheY-like chemotaxis protein
VNLPDITQPEREIARGLHQAVEAVLDSPVDATALRAARDVAQLLGLRGLDRLLAVLEQHAGKPWPHELAPALDRVRRIAERCSIDNDIEAFRDSDPDLMRLADLISDFEWAEGPLPGGADRAVFRAVALSDVLAELPLELRSGDEAFERARLNAPTAAALRAAIEWVNGPSGPHRPIEVAVAEGVLELVCTVQDPTGLVAAHAVLAPVGGQLGPWLADLPASGRWLFRVPLVTPRALHLMITQGDLPLALPWASVLRVMMMPSGDLEARAALMAPDVPLLPPLRPLTRADGECPVVMIASGMLRGLVIADRLVWRLGAEPVPPPSAPPQPLQNAVRGDDGNLYWVADPGVLLAPLAPPAIATALSETRVESSPVIVPATTPGDPRALRSPTLDTVPTPESVPAPIPPEDAVAPAPVVDATPGLAPAPATEVAPVASSESLDEPSPLTVSAETTDAPDEPTLESINVAPLPLEPRQSEAPPPAAPPPAPAAAPEVPPVTSAAASSRRALVVEDSITARIFLVRMLEARGFSVVAVGSGADALREAVRGPWWLVCADVELGDVRGAGWLRMLRERIGITAPMAALVRDRDDREVAMSAGVSRVLRKPFDEAELSELIQRVADTRESS